MSLKRQLSFVLIFTVSGIVWLYWARSFINSFRPPFLDPRESHYNFGLWHFLYGFVIFFPASIVLTKLKCKLLKYTANKNRSSVIFLYGLFGFFIVCYLSFCAIQLLFFPVKGFRVFFDMVIMIIGLPVYFLLLFVSSTGSTLALFAKTLLLGVGIGLTSGVICNQPHFEKAQT